MTYPENLNKLIGFIPAEIYAEHEKQITELADAIATDRTRLKEAVLNTQAIPVEIKFWRTRYYCPHCESRIRGGELARFCKNPDCIARQLEEEKE